jgi:osmotically-inducible protein OsmY
MTRLISKPACAAAALTLTLAGAALLQACVPLAATAVVGTALVVSDRRTTATIAVDKEVEFRGSKAVSDAIGGRGHININAYNRVALLTGEVPSEGDRKLAEESLLKLPNVKSVVNELAVMGNSSLGSRSSDSLITGKVKASFVDAKDVSANSLRVTTERGTVFLQGLVTERESGLAADVASRVSGVQKVVKVFEYISEDELRRITGGSATTSSTPSTPAK